MTSIRFLQSLTNLNDLQYGMSKASPTSRASIRILEKPPSWPQWPLSDFFPTDREAETVLVNIFNKIYEMITLQNQTPGNT